MENATCNWFAKARHDESTSQPLRVTGLRQFVKAFQIEQLKKPRRCAVAYLTLLGLGAFDDGDQAQADELTEQMARFDAANRVDLVLGSRLAIGDKCEDIERPGSSGLRAGRRRSSLGSSDSAAGP